VQIVRDVESPTEGETLTAGVWVDVATVTVSSGSKRRKVIEKALKDAGIIPELDGPPLRVRVLDAASAAETPVGAEQPPPQLKIGDA
jgi:hypothetical protein